MARSHTLLVAAFGLATILAASGCSIEETTTPALTGPSSFGRNLSVWADPDVLVQDGSTARITVRATNAAGQPESGVDVRLDMYKGQPPVMADVGELSTKFLKTGGNGEAVAIYTAPSLADVPHTQSDEIILTIAATPVGRDYSAMPPWSVKIRLVPPGQIIR